MQQNVRIAHCTGVEMPERYSGGNALLDFCYRADLGEKRAALERKYSTEELAELLRSIPPGTRDSEPPANLDTTT